MLQFYEKRSLCHVANKQLKMEFKHILNNFYRFFYENSIIYKLCSLHEKNVCSLLPNKPHLQNNTPAK